MESLPLEIQKEIIQFLQDRSRRQLRLASTQLFNIIGYNNFEIYLTKKSEWRQIVDRFERYDKPISLSVRKNIMTNPNDLFEHLTRLTNLTSFDIDKVEAFSEWHKITVLSNLKSVPRQCDLWCGKAWEKLPKLEKLVVDRDYDMTNDKMGELLNTLTNLRDLKVKSDFTDDSPLKSFTGVRSTLTKLKFRHGIVTEWDNTNLQNLQHVKSLEIRFESETKQSVSLKNLTALEKLKTFVPISDVENCSNLTALEVSEFSHLSNECFAHLQNLKQLDFWRARNGNTEFLTSLTSLEKFVIRDFKPKSYSILGDILPTRLTYLHLGDWFDMSHFSRLRLLTDLKMSENVFDENILYLERLTHLSISVEQSYATDYPDLVLLSRLTNLRKLTCVGHIWSDNNKIDLSPLTNLEYLDINNYYVPYYGLKSLTRITSLRMKCEAPFIYSLVPIKSPPISKECSKAHAKAIYQVTKMTNLRDLIINGYEVDFDAHRGLLRYEGLTNLTKLVLHGCFSIVMSLV